MEIERQFCTAPINSSERQAIAAIKGGCIGCADCKGICTALIDLCSVPSTILSRVHTA